MDKKNVRQIGQVQGRGKIYIEDYAMTFLKQLAEKSGAYARMAVLVGEYEKDSREERFYVYGALEIPSGEAGIGYHMDSAAWTRIYGEMKQYFPDWNIVGWYLTADEPEITKNEWLLRFHRENFAGTDKFLFYYNPGELEELCYLYGDGQLKEQRGYYLFYEKNEAMQAFLVDHNQNRQPETVREAGGFGNTGAVRIAETDAEATGGSEAGTPQLGLARQEPPRMEEPRRGQSQNDADQRVVKEIRRTLEEKQEAGQRKKQPEQGRYSSYLAGAVTAAAVLALCLIVFQYFDRLDSLETSIQELTGNLSGITVMEPDRGEEMEYIDVSAENGKAGKTGEGEINEEEIGGKAGEEAGNGAGEDKGGVLEIETLQGGIVSKSGQTGDDDSGADSSKADDSKADDSGKNDDKVSDEKGGEDEKTETMTDTVQKTEQAGKPSQPKGADKPSQPELTEESSKSAQAGQMSKQDQADKPSKQEEGKPDKSESSGTVAEKQETIAPQEHYVVQPGDTLSGICQRHYQNIYMVEKVMEANGLTDPNGILAGDVLLLP